MIGFLRGMFGSGGGARVQSMPAREAHKAATARKLILIDVRTPGEWAATGMPAGANGVTLQRADFIDAVTGLAPKGKATAIAFICRSGARSGMAAKTALKAGFTEVYNIPGGVEGGGGWLAERLPLKRGEA